ncbi:hypothetical protein CP8484711_1322A, partial [Chlamydia psittaci 84-8471/1]
MLFFDVCIREATSLGVSVIALPLILLVPGSKP